MFESRTLAQAGVRLLTIGALITMALLAPELHARQMQYSAEDLQPLPSGVQSYAVKINDLGDAVGSSTSSPWTVAVFWLPGSPPISIGTLPNGTYSLGRDINNTRQITGEATTNNSPRAFRWTPGEGMINLGVLPGASFGSTGHAINDRGHVVGSSSSSQGERAFLWKPATGMMNLGTLAGSSSSTAYDINNNDVVVGASIGPGVTRAFRWTSQTGMVELPALPNGQGCAALAINDVGDICGWCVNAQGRYRAVVWLNGMSPVDIGVAGPFDEHARAYDINNSRVVVGYSFTPSVSITPFRWTSATGIRNLRQIAPNQSGFWLNYAYGVNERGQIVGEVSYQSQFTHGFRLTHLGDVTGDALVNVDDLLAVINAWGACGPPCAADLTNDGQVNVADLLLVINHWST
jgi:probable HAF family extracellular repeat protein